MAVIVFGVLSSMTKEVRSTFVCTTERCQEGSQEYASVARTPGTRKPRNPHSAKGCEEFPHAFSVRGREGKLSRGCGTLNPWLTSCHPFGVFRDRN
jgi:hypothetical protein